MQTGLVSSHDRETLKGHTMLSLEVIAVPVADADRALEFYVGTVGFNLDVDYRPTSDFRVVQLTPPGSGCSIQLVATAAASPLKSAYLVTDDLQAECERLIARGVTVGAVRHKEPLATWAGGWAPGLDPERRDYASFADFADPDGNTWTLQERGYRAQ